MIHRKIRGVWQRGANRCRLLFSRGVVISFAMALLLTLGGASAGAEEVMRLHIANNSGFGDDQVYLIVVCKEPVGYLDFRTHTLVQTPAFNLDVNAMAASLAQLRQYSGDGTATISFPRMGSTRVYFALGDNFDKMGGFPLSGPKADASNPVIWAFFEVNLSGACFFNQSNVDFTSISHTLSGKRAGSGETVTVGVTTPSDTIFQQFLTIPDAPAGGQQFGNPAVFKTLIIRNAAGDVVRVLAPKSAGYSDFSAGADLPQMATHFLDGYVNNHCWKPNRTFTFSSKDGGDHTVYYGRVSADGLTLSIYTDAAMTTPYAPVPTLPRPSSPWGSPAFSATPALWHNVGGAGMAQNEIDWGYLLYGQDGYSAGPGAHWHLDPVAMAIPISICRGVMHMDNGPVDWKNSANYFQGLNGVSTAEFPMFYYAKILHQYGLAGHVYAFSFDDVYGSDSGVTFTDPNVTLTLYPFSAPPALGPCIRANGRRGTVQVNYPDTVSLSATMNAGQYAGLAVDWWAIAIPNYGDHWYYLDAAMHWNPFPAGNIAACRPAHSGPLANLADAVIILPPMAVPRGTYQVHFAVDYPMDGVLHYPGGQYRDDVVTVVVR